MGVVIDTNTLSAVFKSNHSDHPNFRPVLHWVVCGKAKIVYGGSKYEKELRSFGSILAFLKELSKVNKIAVLDRHAVDAEECRIRAYEKDPDFDDQHLVAIVRVSGCRVVCTNDKRAFRFLKRADLYPKGVARPKIFTSQDHTPAFELLSDQHLCDVDKPLLKLPKETSEALGIDCD